MLNIKNIFCTEYYTRYSLDNMRGCNALSRRDASITLSLISQTLNVCECLILIVNREKKAITHIGQDILLARE